MSSLTVVMPCLNEARTLATCIRRAQAALQQAPLYSYEIIVADNGSTDGSPAMAAAEGARVIHVPRKGYGAALDAGIRAAATDWVLFADADDSYDFGELNRFIEPLQAGADLVVGNRFQGGIAPGAMPALHRYLGTPVISWLGRKSFRVKLGDFNCGMRAIRRDKYDSLDMRSPGMEYASEMIAKAGLQGWHVAEVPVSLRPDGRGRKPHLRTWSDGWKHLRLILLLNPNWLLLYPALVFLVTGGALASLLLFNYVRIARVVLDIHTLYYASIFLLLGGQLLQFYVIARLYAGQLGLYPSRRFAPAISRLLNFERSVVAGSLLFLTGIGLSLYAVGIWRAGRFGPLDPVTIFRIIIPAGFCLAAGMQVIIFGFLLYTLRQWPAAPTGPHEQPAT